MKLRDEFSELLHNELLEGAGERERGTLECLLADLVSTQRLTRDEAYQVENAAGRVAVVMSEAAFMAGFECGQDIRRLLCK